MKDTAANRVGLLHARIREKPCELELSARYSDPPAYIAAKRDHWADIWHEDKADHAPLLAEMREALFFDGLESDLPQLIGSDFEAAAAACKPRAGRGTDVIRPCDLRLAPPAARDELATLFGLIEDLATWPWQLMYAIVALLP